MPELQPFQPLSEQRKSLCSAHHCPSCGTREQVTAERVIEARLTVTRCHCRACGHSWHPQVEDDPISL